MKILFLDDDRARHEVFKSESIGKIVTHVETAEAAIAEMEKHCFDIVCLDHDLGGKVYVESDGPDPTGYTVAKWMVSAANRPSLTIVHSFNRSGAEKMLSLLKDAGMNAFYVPFSLLTLRNI